MFWRRASLISSHHIIGVDSLYDNWSHAGYTGCSPLMSHSCPELGSFCTLPRIQVALNGFLPSSLYDSLRLSHLYNAPLISLVTVDAYRWVGNFFSNLLWAHCHLFSGHVLANGPASRRDLGSVCFSVGALLPVRVRKVHHCVRTRECSFHKRRPLQLHRKEG